MQEKLQFHTFSVPLRISVCKQVTKNLLLYVFPQPRYMTLHRYNLNFSDTEFLLNQIEHMLI